MAASWRRASAGAPRFAIDVPSSFGFARPGVNAVLAISSDGRRIAFAADGALYVWSAETGKVQRLADTAGARAPFFSPDDREIAFFTADELRRIPADGGVATTISRAPGGGAGTWAADGTILFHRWAGDTGVSRVSALGGEPQLLTPSAERADARGAPALLPDGRHYLFATSHVRGAERQMCVASIEGGDVTCLGRADSTVGTPRPVTSCSSGAVNSWRSPLMRPVVRRLERRCPSMPRCAGSAQPG